jgi:hypothetical protein
LPDAVILLGFGRGTASPPKRCLRSLLGFISDIDPGSLPPFGECAFRAAPGVSSPISEVAMIEAFVA